MGKGCLLAPCWQMLSLEQCSQGPRGRTILGACSKRRPAQPPAVRTLEVEAPGLGALPWGSGRD